MVKRKKFLIGGIILFIAIGYLSYTGFMSSATYYYTVSEFMAQSSSLGGDNVKIDGQIAVGSVEQEAANNTLRFTIADAEQGQSLPVVYHGVVPDTFKPGSEIVVEGHLNSDGTFEAHTLMPKCASKYVPSG